MANVYTSPEDLCNAALYRAGSLRRIGNIFEGSEHSIVALQIYSEARDAKLREFEWGFAERNLVLTLLKTAPVGGYNPSNPWTAANPIPPWIFEYAYPGDMVKLRSLRSPNAQLPSFDPKPKLFRIANDTVEGTQQKVILANLANAVAVYTGQVTNPALWEADFTDALIETLVKDLAPALAKLDIEKVATQEEMLETAVAERKLG